ncbi:oxygenase MpaB family protein [Actinomadura xylanilytica]|uniref:oxygenase MpaB family protein n=1 Tax=Actinomadura xylanilytica TaxID=887459 RepID=UPI00255A9882|nr:oxygenase MpaB family protein [Actinomadura xylanilytica]MDL4777040.1 oxygenase MpaB family protein [Actinomadura xylanilytica]
MTAPAPGPDRTVLRLLAAEPAVMLAAGRALLLQVAHPKVAQGVADHSDLRKRPLDRLFGTLDFLTIVAFGTEEEAERMGRAIRRMHERITGPGYSGNDPDLQVWVNATLIDAALYVYERILRSPSGDLAADYIDQARYVADVLGCPPGAQPPDIAAFRRYTDGMIASLEVTDEGREVARAVLWSRKLRWLWPALWLNRFITTGLLPEPIREQYGLPWSPRRDRVLWSLLRTGAFGYRLVPGRLRRAGVPLMLWTSRRRIERRGRRFAARSATA